MRIISGIFGGRTLTTPKNAVFRPTMDRVRETVFNMLESGDSVEGMSVCDLFAGCGSYGIEAMSRGARSVTFVEINPVILEALKRNIADFGIADKAEVLRVKAENFCAGNHEAYDIIFADPPYAFEGAPAMVKAVAENKLLRPGGLLVWEHASRSPLPTTVEFAEIKQRIFGTTTVSFLELAGGPGDFV